MLHASAIIPTPSAIDALRNLALRISLNAPVLITSSPSSGKSILLSYLASLLRPESSQCIIRIHLADTSLDSRSLLGSYVSSVTNPGSFEWKEGVLVRAMTQGKWVVLEDIDRASIEVLGVIKPLVDSLGPGGWIGKRAVLEVPSRGVVEAAESFMLYATRSLAYSHSGSYPKPTFFSAHKFQEVVIQAPDGEDLRTIIEHRFPRLAGVATHGLIALWHSVKNLGTAPSARSVGIRELEHFCRRVVSLLPTSYQPMDVDLATNAIISLSIVFPNPTLREDIYLQARDVFFGAAALNAAAQTYMQAVADVIGEHLELSPERRAWSLSGRIYDFDVEKDVDGRVTAVRAGRVRLSARTVKEIAPPSIRPFAMHKPAMNLTARIAAAIQLNEPVLLTGETGTGKTSVITHLASMLRRHLISLNLSHQTESSDLIGGFKPVDPRLPAASILNRFLELFGSTFSRRKNVKFEESVKAAVASAKWKRAVTLWKEASRMARERFASKKNLPGP